MEAMTTMLCDHFENHKETIFENTEHDNVQNLKNRLDEEIRSINANAARVSLNLSDKDWLNWKDVVRDTLSTSMSMGVIVSPHNMETVANCTKKPS